VSGVPDAPPPLDSALRAKVDAAWETVFTVLAAAKRIRHEDTDQQVHALALHATVIEQFSACIRLAEWGEPNPIPILLRSMYEAVVDLDNLLQDGGYLERMEAANLKQTINLMKGPELQKEFQHGRKELAELSARLAQLKGGDKGPLDIWERCRDVGRTAEYEGLYRLLSLDAHNNASALAERHISDGPGGVRVVSIFGPYEPQRVAMRLDIGLQFLFDSAGMIHGKFGVPAPEVKELAARFDRERAARHAS
jgi:hypothetical protein